MSFLFTMNKEQLIAKAAELKTRDDLLDLLTEIKAELMGDKLYPFTHKQVAIFSNPKLERNRYKTFFIPKKSGGQREICAPHGNLKWMQICLNELFKALYTPSPYAMGFTIGRSIVDNARTHTNQNYVFNIDLKDFFPSIDQARVWKRLQLAPFNFNKEIASMIAGLCSMRVVTVSNDDGRHERFVLPQGAPTSPILTNAICDTLDRRLHGLAKRFGLHYSRYADDITFSSMHNVYQDGSEFRLELQRIITEQRFTINPAKTRLCHCGSRQEVTGLTVGAKINVTRKYVKDLRAILHIWEKYGHDAAYATFYPRYISEKCQINRGTPNLVNVISGKLCYLKMVKGEKDPVYIKLRDIFLKLTKPDNSRKPKSAQIEYLFTMSKTDFENKLGVTINLQVTDKNHKQIGTFEFQERTFLVSVSKNLDINKLPDNVQISLCRLTRVSKFYVDSDVQRPQTLPVETSVMYLLHKKHIHTPSSETQDNPSDETTDTLRDFVIQLAETYPELQLKDDAGIIEEHNNKNLLARLVDTNFDLSILP